MTTTTPPTATAGIRAEHICTTLGGTEILRDVSLDVPAGTIHALVGLNGAGKTTLLRTLLGMLDPGAGRASLFGADVASLPRGCWCHVSQMIEAPFAYPELSVRENIYSSARLHGLERAAARSATTDAIAALDLTAYAGRPARLLSTGNRQRTGLAAALVHAPTVIVFDEPSNALDPRGVIVLRELLRAAARDRGAAILISSHHLDEVARMADTISVLHGGRIIGTLPPGTPDLERQFFELVLGEDTVDGTIEGTVENTVDGQVDGPAGSPKHPSAMAAPRPAARPARPARTRPS